MESEYQPENDIKVWITLTSGGDGLPIAHHIQQEGRKVIVGQIQEKSELKNEDKETPEEKKGRLAQYDGILTKYPARKLINALKKVKNKDDYYIYCEHNNLWAYAEELLKAGFTKGNFPTKQDFDFEKDRQAAMEFVEENYPDIQIIPHQEVDSVEEARKIIEESEVPLVIQSEGDFVSTVVGADDVEQSKIMLLATLEKNEKDYKKGKIILKEKLVQPIEITPQIIFWDGKPVFTDIDIETKNIGDGENNGNQVGCGTNLIIATDMDEEINQIAFPPKIYEMAKERKGLFIWDISLYFTEKGIFFGEFCSNRFGYDALMTEMTMAHGPTEYFGLIMEGKNPIRHFKFGMAVRIFNLNRTPDQEINIGSWKPTWLYEAHLKDDRVVSIGECWDLCVMTGRGNTIEEGVDNLYDNLETLTFKEKYFRTKADFMSDYPTSIIRRYKETNGIYFTAPDIQNEKEVSEKKIEEVKKSYKEKLDGYKQKLKEVIYGQGTVQKS